MADQTGRWDAPRVLGVLAGAVSGVLVLVVGVVGPFLVVATCALLDGVPASEYEPGNRAAFAGLLLGMLPVGLGTSTCGYFGVRLAGRGRMVALVVAAAAAIVVPGALALPLWLT